jgi:SAM-dependent methyltransferase
MARLIERRPFDRAFHELVIDNRFVEGTDYYRKQEPRYRRTLELLCPKLPDRDQLRILEIGGGQIAMLMARLFGDEVAVADLSKYEPENVTRFGFEHMHCDLLRDRWVGPPRFDVLVLAEVVEHLPVPLHVVLRRNLPCLVPGGLVCITTPNFFRLRNVVRTMIGKRMFCDMRFPKRGSGIGHPFEFSADQLAWQLSESGLNDVDVSLEQLVNAGATLRADIQRKLAAPLLAAIPRWRDNLVAFGRMPGADPVASDDLGRFEPDSEWVAAIDGPASVEVAHTP